MRLPAALSLAAALVGCGSEAPPVAEPELMARGESVSAALAGKLTGSLQRAIAERGLTEAVAFCHAEAGALTAEVAGAHPEVRSVRRIGVRVRQPDNRADAMDLRALDQFASAKAEGLPPSPLLLREALPDGGERARYYRPVLTAPLCLACHGPVDRIPPPVAETLRRLYPGDRAVGFEAGDLRGAIVVEF